MRFALLHSPSLDLRSVAAALDAEDVTPRAISRPGDLDVADVPTALLLDPDARDRFPAEVLRRFATSGGAVVAIGAAGEHDVPDSFPDGVLAAFVPRPHGPRQLLVALRAAYREAAARSDVLRARQEAVSRTRELGELTRIGMALATERDYHTLLDLILTQARALTASDAGSLYLVEEREEGPPLLHFKHAQNFSRPDIPIVTSTLPLDRTSIAGYVATTGEPLVIDDAYELSPDVEFSINRTFDDKYRYRTQSLLTIPMKDHKEQVIGVLQLINRKRHGEAKLVHPQDFDAEVIRYSQRVVELVSALAGQAAVSIENSGLYEDIERLFEGFVRAAVTAIEQRDPTTFGHSGRVASMTVGLAEAVDRASGPFRGITFTKEEIREIRYAGLLHDFGKVGVREQVLVKAKKLYPAELTLIEQRHAFIRRTAEREFHRRHAGYLAERGRDGGYEAFLTELRDAHERELAQLDRFLRLVGDANEPSLLAEGAFEELLDVAARTYEDPGGVPQPYLTGDEVRFLTIRKGSLDPAERLEIESHVTHTYKFLLQIPWTKELQSVPVIAYGHHEKLDGSGYPRRVTGGQIPIQTRMMTIADIFDALTASDRPYKRAVPRERALAIMEEEVEGGALDPDLAKMFVEAKAFEVTEER